VGWLNLDSEAEVRQAIWSAAIHRRFGDLILAGSGNLLPEIPRDDFRLCSQAA
jgi:hypothetical protein